MGIFFKTIIVFALSYSIGHAQLEREFCQTYYSPRGAQGTQGDSHLSISKSVSLLYKFVFRPSSLVNIQELETNSGDTNEEVSKTVIDFINDVSLSKEESSRLNGLKKEVKRAKAKLKELGFYQKLKEARSKEECIIAFQVSGIRDPLSSIEKVASDFQELNEKETASKLFKLSRKKLKVLIKKGWEVIRPLSFNGAHTYIRDNPGKAVLILAHATPEGMLIDPMGKALPSAFFQNLSIDALIIYSCYTEEVIKHYGFRHLRNIKNYYYPLPHSSWEKVVGNGKIPVEGLSAVLKLQLRKGIASIPERGCIFLTGKNNSSMGVFLNKVYVGQLREEVSFSCNLLKTGNLLEIYNVTNLPFTKDPQIESIYLDGTNIFLKTYMSPINNKHIVTKGEF